MPPDVTARRQPVDQFDRAVMLDLQPLCQFSDSGPGSRRQAFQCQHQLMLTRFQPRVAGGLLAEVKKAADLIAQLCQRFVVG